MSRSLLSEKICPDLCVYMVFMNMNILNMKFLNMNMLFFFMFSLPIETFFHDFCKKRPRRRGCVYKKEGALKDTPSINFS